ncbi:polyphosphate kinase 2 family protein [Nocardia sp. NPDC052254]|uniref:polyphosphate kinase 2 family protein n=1 Tax=Nocardia sp. NPDC052254 TaxID=3155681 RepID=UPI00343FFD12
MAKSPWTESAGTILRAGGVRLDSFDPGGTPGFTEDKKTGEQLLAERGRVLSELQEMLFAGGRSGDRRNLLLVLQGMDTAGKGGVVRHVIGAVDPQGVRHAAFGVPTEEERAHDFLWRIHRRLPGAGQIGVFDRSHYEDVLVARVHNLVERAVWERRYDEINDFEREVADAGTTIVKVAMFVSLDEQKRRLTQRLERPDKYWKYDPSDIDDRSQWPQYQQAYQDVLDRTDTDYAPWYVVPADRKWYARLAITELLIEALRNMELDWPKPHFDIEAEKARLAAS